MGVIVNQITLQTGTNLNSFLSKPSKISTNHKNIITTFNKDYTNKPILDPIIIVS
jgi:hypothetical protein